MRQLTIRYLARDGRTKAMCYFGETDPGVWRMATRLSSRARGHIERQAREAGLTQGVVESAQEFVDTVMPQGQRAKRPWVFADDTTVIFHGYFAVSTAKLWPILTAIADQGQTEVDVSTVRVAVDRGIL